MKVDLQVLKSLTLEQCEEISDALHELFRERLSHIVTVEEIDVAICEEE